MHFLKVPLCAKPDTKQYCCDCGIRVNNRVNEIANKKGETGEQTSEPKREQRMDKKELPQMKLGRRVHKTGFPNG